MVQRLLRKLGWPDLGPNRALTETRGARYYTDAPDGALGTWRVAEVKGRLGAQGSVLGPHALAALSRDIRRELQRDASASLPTRSRGAC